MRVDISPPHRLARLRASLAFLASGNGSAAIELYSAGGELLVRVELASPPGSLVDDEIELVPLDPAGGLILASGIAARAKVVNAAGAWVFDGDVGTLGADTVVQLPDLQLRAGGRCPLQLAAIG